MIISSSPLEDSYEEIYLKSANVILIWKSQLSDSVMRESLGIVLSKIEKAVKHHSNHG